MNAFDMSRQVAAYVGTVRTVRARVRFFAGMDSRVAPQQRGSIRSVEEAAADLTERSRTAETAPSHRTRRHLQSVRWSQ